MPRLPGNFSRSKKSAIEVGFDAPIRASLYTTTVE